MAVPAGCERVHGCSQAAQVGSGDLRTLGGIRRAGSQEEDYARAQMAGSVRAAVSVLPPKLRIAVLLRYFDDLSYQQMAQVLRCSMGTVASRLSRGHKILAERLTGLG